MMYRDSKSVFTTSQELRAPGTRQYYTLMATLPRTAPALVLARRTGLKSNTNCTRCFTEGLNTNKSYQEIVRV